MRTVFIGAGEVSIETAKALVKKGHEVVIIETDKAKIDELSDEIDCSFLHADGSRPAVLREVNPEHTDILFCLTDSDQANVIASLVGRSLGFKRVVTSVRDEQFEGICHELRLEDMVGGSTNLELSTVLKDEARVFTFEASEEDAGAVKELKLPTEARVVMYYREGKFALADEGASLHEGDEVVILTHSKNLKELERRWEPKQPAHEPSDATMAMGTELRRP
jgi:trk system potassium uptake protein TrkA